MKYQDEVRVNLFDEWVGKLQTQRNIELGVGESLLDVGCGIGQFTPLYLEKFKRVVGLDPSADYLREARLTNSQVEYVQGYGETFHFLRSFDTIVMNNLLEHVEDPVALLKHCKEYLKIDGVLVAQVPNAESITRRLGVLMGIIDSTTHISERERDFFGHKRTYTLQTLMDDCSRAGLSLIGSGGVLYKPLPNEILLQVCKGKGEAWQEKFLQALYEFGRDRPEECAQIYVVCEK